MDFLALVKRLASETGTELESKITTLHISSPPAYGQTTEHTKRLVGWIREAWVDVQEDQDQWNFMVDRVRVDLAKGQHDYPIGALVNKRIHDTLPHPLPAEIAEVYDYIIPFVAIMEQRYIWIVDGSVSPPTRNKCYLLPAEYFFGERDRHNDGAFGTPYRYSINRKGCLVFDTSPSHDNFYVEFEYKRLPQFLRDDAELPYGLANKHHSLIVYTAMKFYAGFDETEAQWKRASILYRDKMNKLRLNELKDYSIPGDRS